MTLHTSLLRGAQLVNKRWDPSWMQEVLGLICGHANLKVSVVIFSKQQTIDVATAVIVYIDYTLPLPPLPSPPLSSPSPSPPLPSPFFSLSLSRARLIQRRYLHHSHIHCTNIHCACAIYTLRAVFSPETSLRRVCWTASRVRTG